MISPRLRELIEAARATLPEVEDWEMLNSLPRPASRPPAIEAPADYIELLQITDGLGCGRIVVFDAKFVARSQFYTEVPVDAPVDLNPTDWFCFGTNSDEPLLIQRATGAVHGFPDTGVEWARSDRFEQFAPSLDEFLTDHVFGPGYPALAGVDDDEWSQVLRRLRRLS